MLSLGLMKLKLLPSLAECVRCRHLVSLSVISRKSNIPMESRVISLDEDSQSLDLFYIEEGREDKYVVWETPDAKGRRCKRTLLSEQLGIPREGNAPFLIPALSPFFHRGHLVSGSHRSRKFQRLHIKAPPPFSRPLHYFVYPQSLFPRSFNSTQALLDAPDIPRNNVVQQQT